MSENNDYGNNDESSGVNHRRRRTILAAIAGSMCIGGYLNRDSIQEFTKQAGYTPGDGADIESDQLPATNEDEADPSEPHSPWEKDTVTVTWIQGSPGPLNGDYGIPGIQNAISFWNDYLTENTNDDLTLNFEENANNPDIEITLSSHIETDDDTEHVLPSTGETGLQPYVRVETLTENPLTSDETNAEGENLPVRAEISSCGGSATVFNHVAKHVFGRLIGCEIWSDPVDVMTPKNLFGISWGYGDNVQFVLNTLSFVFNHDMENINNQIPRNLNGLADATPESLPRKIEDVKEFILEKHDDIERTVNQDFTVPIEQAMEENPGYIDLSNYLEAYEETVVSEELAHITETATLIDELLAEIENVENTEIRSLENYSTLITRLETMTGWDSNEDFSMRVHRHATDAYWSEYEWPESPPEPDE